jgi:hypothetical protein
VVLIQVLDEKDGKDREFREESRQAEEKLEAKDREASAFSPRVALRTPLGSAVLTMRFCRSRGSRAKSRMRRRKPTRPPPLLSATSPRGGPVRCLSHAFDGGAVLLYQPALTAARRRSAGGDGVQEAGAALREARVPEGLTAGRILALPSTCRPTLHL